MKHTTRNKIRKVAEKCVECKQQRREDDDEEADVVVVVREEGGQKGATKHLRKGGRERVANENLFSSVIKGERIRESNNKYLIR